MNQVLLNDLKGLADDLERGADGLNYDIQGIAKAAYKEIMSLYQDVQNAKDMNRLLDAQISEAGNLITQLQANR